MSRPSLSRLPPPVEAQLRRHCEEQWPNEACGAIFGSGDGATEPWQVAEIRPAPNEHGEDHKRRYLVPPEFQLEAERHARAAGLDVLGYYHSHPEHPAQPSEYDRVHAWPGYLYLICSVRTRIAAELNAFTLVESGEPFVEVEIGAASREK